MHVRDQLDLHAVARLQIYKTQILQGVQVRATMALTADSKRQALQEGRHRNISKLGNTG